MAKQAMKTPLTRAAVQIGTALGKATRAAREVGKVTPQTRKDLNQMKKSLKSLVREVERATNRVKKALR
jgi:hypothetical protein